MSENIFVNQNGKFINDSNAVVSVNNRSFRYGDGCFETMKIISGKLLMADYHFERLFLSLKLLQFDVPSFITPTYLHTQILELTKRNKHQKLARIRLTIYRGEGGLYDPQNLVPNFIIQSWVLNPTNNIFNENGLVIDVFEGAKKVCDNYSAIKSNNYLGYAMAALWVKQQQLNDAVLLNPYNRIADATIANVFMVKEGMVKTPSLNEGGINGIMRRNLLEKLPEIGIPVEETTLSVEELLMADEVFLTNSIYGIRWVKQLKEKKYSSNITSLISKKIVHIYHQHS